MISGYTVENLGTGLQKNLLTSLLIISILFSGCTVKNNTISNVETTSGGTKVNDEMTFSNDNTVKDFTNDVNTDDEIKISQRRKYSLTNSIEVNGRQGIAVDGDYYYVSGSTTLTKYDKDWNIVLENDDPFSEGYTAKVNHIGDIDAYNNEVYCGVELFLDGVGSNIQITVYDADTLKFKRAFPFSAESGQAECSGICVNPDNNTVWMCSWASDPSSKYLYKYDLNDGKYLGKVHMYAAPEQLQGIAYYDGYYYLTADDGEADYDEPDHVYRVIIKDDKTEATVIEDLELSDVKKQGEIEGLSFDKKNNQLFVLYNRGVRIILGMPKGFYDGYDKEIHEVYIYNFINLNNGKNKRDKIKVTEDLIVFQQMKNDTNKLTCS